MTMSNADMLPRLPKQKTPNQHNQTNGIIFPIMAGFGMAAIGAARINHQETSESSQTYDPEIPQMSNVHLRKQIRKGRKYITIVEGLAYDLDFDRILNFLKKLLATNGVKKKTEEYGIILQFNGDVRQSIKNFLVKYNICEAKLVILHGE